MITPAQSLVRYDNPVLVSRTDGVNFKTQNVIGSEKSGKPPINATVAATSGGAPKKLPPVDDRTARTKTPTSQTEDILNSILPPREWDESGQLWVQKVSSTPATRLDVINLQEQLDHMLQKRQARETGICPVRRELYIQTF
ncbi:Axonemal dynein light intermediate polypeptide 1, partial [Physocladia obscura]